MVIQGDKTQVTGWGETFPRFSNKYNHFLGMVYFSSRDGRKLPWNTTKQGVEREAPVFQAALVEMKVQARPILNFLNALYPSDGDEEAGIDRDAFEKATSVSVTKLARQESTFSVLRTQAITSDWINILYKRKRADVDRIRRHLEKRKLSASKIGEMTFDYYVAQELGS
jgi:hypothetical protein